LPRARFEVLPGNIRFGFFLPLFNHSPYAIQSRRDEKIIDQDVQQTKSRRDDMILRAMTPLRGWPY